MQRQQQPCPAMEARRCQMDTNAQSQTMSDCCNWFPHLANRVPQILNHESQALRFVRRHEPLCGSDGRKERGPSAFFFRQFRFRARLVLRILFMYTTTNFQKFGVDRWCGLAILCIRLCIRFYYYYYVVCCLHLHPAAPKSCHEFMTAKMTADCIQDGCCRLGTGCSAKFRSWIGCLNIVEEQGATSDSTRSSSLVCFIHPSWKKGRWFISNGRRCYMYL